MFKTILVPTDGSPLSDKAVDAAIELAKRMGSKLVGISVAEPVPYVALAEGARSKNGRGRKRRQCAMRYRHRVLLQSL
jgi:nucleotide-binding universal stress UspA family protein